MNTSSQTPEKRKPLKKILLLLAVSAVFLFVAVITALLLFPKLVSTAGFKNYIERHSTTILTEGVGIDKLFWSWSDGIILENIFINDDPSFSGEPVIRIKRAFVRPAFSDLFKRRLSVDVIIDGIYFNYIRDESGKTNIETLLLPLKPVPEEKKAPGEKPLKEKPSGDVSISLPLDVSVKIHLDGIFLSADDRMANRKLDVGNGSVHLDIPSVYHLPVTLNVAADTRIDRNDPIPIDISLSLLNNGNIPNEIRPENLSIDICGELPGIELTAKGGLGEKGLKSRIDIRPGVVLETVKPFLSDNLKNSAVNGRVELNLSAEQDSGKKVNFNAGIHVKDVSASGEFLKNKQVGPVNLAAITTGAVDMENSILDITDGRIRLQEEGIINWTALVSGFSSGRPNVAAAITHGYLNLEEIHKLSAVFLPPDFPLTFHHDPKKGPPNIKIEEVLFSRGDGDGENRVAVKSLAIDLPGIGFRNNENAVLIRDMLFTIEEMETGFKNMFPLMTHVRAGLTAGIVEIPGHMRIAGFKKVLDAECRVKTKDYMELDVKEFSLHVPSVRLNSASTGRLDTDAGITVTPCRIVFHQGQLDIEDGSILLSVGKFLNAEVGCTIRDTAKSKLMTRGDLRVNLGEIPEALFADYKGRLKVSGAAVLGWQFDGRLPGRNETKLLSTISGINTGEALSFIDHAGVRLSLDRVDTRVKLDGGNTIAAGGITASPLFSYEYDHEENAGEVLGHIMIKEIKTGRKSGMGTPMALDVSLKGEHSGLHRVSFHETAVLEPFSIEQSIDVNLFGADKIIEKRLQSEPRAWLTKSGGDVKALVKIKNMSGVEKLNPNLNLSGAMAAGLILELLPAKMADARLWMDASDIDLRMPGIVGIRDLNGRLTIKKTYQIVVLKEGNQQSPGSELTPLSSMVMENAFGIIPKTTGPAVDTRWYHAHGKNHFHPERSIGFSSMKIEKGAVPVHVDRFKADINLENGLPGIEYFQNDILEGTVSGSIKTEKTGGTYFLVADINFTGIDFNTILPAGNEGGGTEDTEVSGRLKLTLPITDDMDEFLGKMEHHLLFTHIGSRALERLLYAMDPYESNEAVVSQRRLLQKGFPRWAELKVKDGSLSMGGAVSIEGVDIDLPGLERLNITNLPGMEKYADRLAGLQPVVKILDMATASAIKLGDGELNAESLE